MATKKETEVYQCPACGQYSTSEPKTMTVKQMRATAAGPGDWVDSVLYYCSVDGCTGKVAVDRVKAAK